MRTPLSLTVLLGALLLGCAVRSTGEGRAPEWVPADVANPVCRSPPPSEETATWPAIPYWMAIVIDVSDSGAIRSAVVADRWPSRRGLPEEAGDAELSESLAQACLAYRHPPVLRAESLRCGPPAAKALSRPARSYSAVVLVDVDARGRVERARIVSRTPASIPPLDHAWERRWLAHVRRSWTFEPARVDGVARPESSAWVIRFRGRDDARPDQVLPIADSFTEGRDANAGSRPAPREAESEAMRSPSRAPVHGALRSGEQAPREALPMRSAEDLAFEGVEGARRQPSCPTCSTAGMSSSAFDAMNAARLPEISGSWRFWDEPAERHHRALEEFHETFPHAGEALFVGPGDLAGRLRSELGAG